MKELQRRPHETVGELYLMFYKDPLTTHAEGWSPGYEEPDRASINSQLVKTKKTIEASGHKVTCATAVGHTAGTI